MRRAKARRLSRWLFTVDLIQYDIYAECVKIGGEPTYNAETGKFHYKVDRGAVFERCHSCCYELVKIVFSHLVNSNSCFQKQKIQYHSMSSPLSLQIVSDLEAKGVDLVSVPGFRHTRPQPLRRKKKVHPDVARVVKELEDELPVDVKTDYDEYLYSADVDDIVLQAKGYTVLCEKPPRDADFDQWYEMFLRMAVQQPEVEPLHIPPVTVEKLMDQTQANSSAGLLNLNSLFGECIGTKKQMQAGAAAINLNDLQGKNRAFPSAQLCKPAGKLEVIKKNKKVRTIQVESQADFMILKYYGEHFVTESDVPSGRAIGLSTLRGDFKQIIFTWYKIWLHYNNGSWNKFLDWLDHAPISMSDKTAWESSTNAVDGSIYVWKYLLSFTTPRDPNADRVLARALADYMNPAIQIDKDKVYFAPWRIASGSYLTADGNTRRHMSMTDWICDFLETHGNEFQARDDCTCIGCRCLRDNPDIGGSYQPMDIDLLRHSFKLGDDDISINPHPYAWDKFMDAVFGTTTKSEETKFFSQPGLFKPEGAEFLKKHFYLDKSSGTWNVRIFRAPARLLAKLCKGSSNTDNARFYVACQSALWECGYNKPLYDLVRRMAERLQSADVDARFSHFTKDYVKRSPALGDSLAAYIPDWNVIVDADASLLYPMEKVWWWFTTYWNYKITPAYYK
uniref:Putative RNA dependent RNA polymerase n=1 Tax=Sina virus TaxID=2703872 RepID=A0A6G9L829_9VIRU|nr:MAG: putative RNA dependent RNA polymerase [Sina virus]